MSKEKENLDEIEDILDEYLDKKKNKTSETKTATKKTSTTKKTTTNTESTSKKTKNVSEKEVVDDDDDDKKEKKNSPIMAIILGIVVALIIILLLLKGCNKTQEYTISFDSNGGSRVVSMIVEENGTITKPTDPTKEGYTFAGWYYKDKEFDFSTKVTRDMILEAKWNIAEPEKPNNIVIADNNLSIILGSNGTIIISSLPEGVNAAELEWTSSDSSVATVTADGIVKSVGVGNATITIKSKDGVYSTTCNVTVTKEEIIAESVEISGTAEVTVGSSIKLTATVKPTNATDKKVTWTSSNPSIATVDANGNVKALKEGTVTITVTTSNGKTTTKTITIKPQTSNSNSNSNATSNKPSNTTSNKTSNTTSNKTSNATSNKPSNTTKSVTNVTIDGGNKTMTVGDTGKLTATIKPTDATNKNVTWTSSNTSVVTIDKNTGAIKAVGAGTATITVTTVDGNKTATIQITVKEKVSVYVVTLTPLKQSTGNVMEYKIAAVTKDGDNFSGFTKIGGYPRGVGKKLSANMVSNGTITNITLTLSDGTEVNASVKYTAPEDV